ncbi:hypothetical protein FEM48_Zijuj07G0163700 [Ziziphus jujuba var. spinosa]|uniref:Glycosyl transferase CAP10 domain-containing protein n=1 Tax=Ziziphus jujuba var. spinosa TaxID=714518 RepID=A0A978V5P1_ZIZJJ|nr:hypothetical protein FEM48_Zijuj07G0163700 [Ziziphus jujuba var. spinosa]
MVDRARRTAHFRLVVVNGKAYIEKYRQAIQTRDIFTIWGILQLLRLYPGRLPDFELMFDCDDRPVVRSEDFHGPNDGPPPLFRYCGDDSSLDIVFPDWSFWGWAETNIRPWSIVLEDIKEGNKKTKWKDRIPYAYWRGNPHVTPTRKDLLSCNSSQESDWNTRLYIQDWDEQIKQGFKDSNVGDQCTHRGMLPLHHYWPIRDNSKCTSLKFAVDWANNHTNLAEAIGKAGSKFIQEDVKMEYVYDYMFHLLNEYAKLLKFKPSIKPLGAEGTLMEVCSETMACSSNGISNRFMRESMVKYPSHSLPCTLPPYDPHVLADFFEKKANLTRQVEIWEDEYWHKSN